MPFCCHVLKNKVNFCRSDFALVCVFLFNNNKTYKKKSKISFMGNRDLNLHNTFTLRIRYSYYSLSSGYNFR